MSMDVKGFEDIFGTLDSLGNVGDKVGKTAVKAGAKIALNSIKKYAPKDSGKSAKALRITSTKKFKGGQIWSQVGIDSKNWEQTKGLFFQNYGYTHWKSGEKVQTNVGWMDTAFKKCEKEASEVIINEVSKELDRILR